MSIKLFTNLSHLPTHKQAKVIVVMSATGRMASYIAKFRPCTLCLMLTPDLVAARQASALLLGTHTVQVDSLEATEELIDEVNYELVESGEAEPGDSIVVVAGAGVVHEY